MKAAKIKKRIGLGVLNLFFIVICIACMIPILYAFTVSINGQNDLLSADFACIPHSFTLGNYRAVRFDKPFLT